VDKLVNKTWYLDGSFVPENLTPLSVHAGASGTQLSKEAADAMEEWAAGGKAVGVSFYASSSYRSYDSQTTLYDNYVFLHGQEQADRESARPGFSEHQTGLTVDVTAVGDEDKDFSETSAFIWASANCMDYGWILRYPENKEDITGYEYESWHYRYVGKDLAQALYKTGMTYDEFWSLYLKPWSDEANKPSEAILQSTDWHNLLISEEAPAEGEEAAETAEETAQADAQ
jgi:D-alanyl-D-alanine carboxypeptidase